MIFIKIIRDDGAVLEVGDGTDGGYELLEKFGTSNVEAEQFYDEKGSGFGDWKSGERIKARKFGYKIRAHTSVAASRRFTSYFFNYLHRYRIESYFGNKKVYIYADLSSLKSSEDLYSVEDIKIDFYADDPYWKSLDDTTRSFYTQSGLWHYPYAFIEPGPDLPMHAYTVYERVNVNKVAYIFNDGDAPAGFTVTINGVVNSPELTINNSIIRYDGVVGSGKTLFIDPANAVYTLDGINCLRNMIVTGEPALQVGDNKIVSNTNMFGTINFSKLYNGDM